jgi:hypothetical protein
MCRRKRRDAKRSKAAIAAKRVAHRIREPIHSYPCPFCAGFHIGHVTLARRRDDTVTDDG